MTSTTGNNKESLLYKARLAEQTERHDDMLAAMKKVAELDVELSVDERNLLSLAFKNMAGTIRSSYRTIASIEKKLSNAKKVGDVDVTKQEAVQMYREKIQCEMEELCGDVVRLIDTLRLPKAGQDVEQQIFYLKMKADYFRYLAEVLSNRDDAKDIAEKCRDYYQQSQELAAMKLPAANPLRLGVALNYSVFLYEIANDTTSANQVAKTAFDMAVEELDGVSEEVYRESVVIMQLIRDNLALWGSISAAEHVEQAEDDEEKPIEPEQELPPKERAEDEAMEDKPVEQQPQKEEEPEKDAAMEDKHAVEQPEE